MRRPSDTTNWVVRVQTRDGRCCAIGQHGSNERFELDLNGDAADEADAARFMANSLRRDGKCRFHAWPSDQERLAHVIEAMNEPYAPWPPDADPAEKIWWS